MGHRRLASVKPCDDLAVVADHDRRVLVGREPLGPADAVHHEQVGTLRLTLRTAETEPDDERILELGRAKREAKRADLLVVNRVGWTEGFASDENSAVVIGDEGEIVTRLHGSKASVAHGILDVVVSKLN